MRKIFTLVMSLSGFSIYSQAVFFEDCFARISSNRFFNATCVLIGRTASLQEGFYGKKDEVVSTNAAGDRSVSEQHRFQSYIRQEHNSIISNKGFEGATAVTLRYFSIISKSKQVQLEWMTENQINHNHFEIERSINNRNFKTIALILGARSAQKERNNYEYLDKAGEIVAENIVYYRLKQVDKSGRITYSATKTIHLDDARN